MYKICTQKYVFSGNINKRIVSMSSHSYILYKLDWLNILLKIKYNCVTVALTYLYYQVLIQPGYRNLVFNCFQHYIQYIVTVLECYKLYINHYMLIIYIYTTISYFSIGYWKLFIPINII